MQQRPVLAPSGVWQALTRERAQIEAWLTQKPPLRLTRVHDLLQRKGVAAGYTTLRRYVERELGWQKCGPTVRIADPPLGEEAQVDFGQMGMVTSSDGRRRKLWVLIVTLSCSRYQSIWPTFEQTTEEVCAGLDAACRGGGHDLDASWSAGRRLVSPILQKRGYSVQSAGCAMTPVPRKRPQSGLI